MSSEVKPLDEEIEITLIGTGGGYGESVLIHVGNQNWIIVDSCVNPKTNTSLPLEYLRSIGVDYKKDVKLIVCSHWHDDHIKGMSELFLHCEAADLCYAFANDLKKFLGFVSLDYQKIKLRVSNSSTHEFNKCLEILKDRGKVFKHAHSDLLLFSSGETSFKTEVFALSPSDFTASLFEQEIGQLITDYGAKNKKIIPESPNARSVALYLKFGNYRAILGADLEVGDQHNSGWHNILDHAQCIDRHLKSSFFKIPHHGSLNGYHPRVWQELLEVSPVAALTPWNKNSGLPTDEMVNLYCSQTDKIFITSEHKKATPKKRSHRMEKMIKDFQLKIVEVAFEKGIIRSRIDAGHDNSQWQVETLDAARALVLTAQA